MKDDTLIDWLFWYNPYEELWYGYQRDYHNQFHSNRDSVPSSACIKSKNINEIIRFLNFTKHVHVEKRN